MTKRDLRNGLYQVIFANSINLIVAICNGFLIPRYLSIHAYSDYKTFILYTGYLGILHLGFIDGIYIKYGGKDRSDVSPDRLYQISIVLLVFQSLVTAVGIVVSLLIHDGILLIAALCTVPCNMQYMYKFIFQAIGEFDNYRRMITLQTICVFLFNLIAIFILHTDNSRVYMYGFYGINGVLWIGFSFYFRELFQIVRLKINGVFAILKEYISLGIIVMLGNLMGVWMTSVDRWFVKIRCTDIDFAYYSFAVTMLRLVNVVFNAFSVTLYNFFCEKQDNKLVKDIRRKIIIISAVILSGSFAINTVVDWFIPNYKSAESIIIILVSSQLFYVIVNAVYLNMYKALNLQKRYLIIMLIISILSIILNAIIGTALDNSMISFAYATVLTFVIWLIICSIDLKDYRIETREWIFLVLSMILYYSAYCFFNPVVSFCIYLCMVVLLSLLIFNQETLVLFRYASGKLRKSNNN